MSERSIREFYRVDYPLAERPLFVLGDTVLQVLDCSEVGFRYYAGALARPEPGTALKGWLRFRRGPQIDVRGEVVWVRNGQVAVALTNSRIPLSIIYKEQRYLRAHYPMR